MTRVRSTARVAACTRYPRVGGHLGSAWPLSFKHTNSKTTDFLSLMAQSSGLYNPRIGLHCFLYTPGLLPNVQHIKSGNIPFSLSTAHHCRFNGLHICTEHSRSIPGLYSRFPVQAFWIYHAVTRLTPCLFLLSIGDYTCTVHLIIRANTSVQGLDSRLDTIGEKMTTIAKTLSLCSCRRPVIRFKVLMGGLAQLVKKRLQQANPSLCSYMRLISDTPHTC